MSINEMYQNTNGKRIKFGPDPNTREIGGCKKIEKIND
jgi:hypothetical protein